MDGDFEGTAGEDRHTSTTNFTLPSLSMSMQGNVLGSWYPPRSDSDTCKEPPKDSDEDADERSTDDTSKPDTQAMFKMTHDPV